jgi:hypothetical protein
LLLTGATKREILTNAEANRFYQSIVMHDIVDTKAADENSWKLFTMDQYGLEIEFPGTPERNKELEDGYKSNPNFSSWIINCYAVSDPGSDIYYMLFVKTTKPGYHLLNDTALFGETRRNVETSYADSIFLYEEFIFQGFPAIRLNASHKESEYLMQSLHVNRGDRCYSLIVVGNENNSNDKDFGRYLNSFKLSGYKKVQWSEQLSPDSMFKTWAPSPMSIVDMERAEENRDPDKLSTFIAIDSLSSYSFAVNKELISPYYWTNSDSTFFETHSSDYIGDQDTLLEKKSIQNGTVKGMEYTIKSKVVSNIKCIRLLPYGNTLYVIWVMLPAVDLTDKDHLKFFNEFRFINNLSRQTYLENKSSKLLEDLLSKDSSTFYSASDAIDDAPFTTKDLPLLHQAMLIPYQDFDPSLQCTHDKILSAVVKLKDQSTLEFIEKNYPTLKDSGENLKYPLLSVLTRICTKESYNLFSKLVIEQTPTSGNARMLQYYLRDSLLLTASLFPQILQLTGDSNFIKALPIIVNELLDSNLISINDLKPHLANFYRYAERELIRLMHAEEYDYHAGSIVELLARINEAASNDILQRFIRARQLNIKMNAAIGLIKNNQPVDPLQLEKIGEDRNYRNDLYEQLRDINKERLFPAKYSSQKSIAESEIYLIASDDYEPSSIQFIGERITNFEGEKQKFLLFKIVYKYEDADPETYLGITGPYPLNKKKIITDSKVSGLFTEEFYDAKKIDKQLKTYLLEVEEYFSEILESGK